MRHWMIETEHIGMEAKSMARIIAIAILDVTTHGMTKVLHVNAYLVLASRFEFELHEGVLAVGLEHAVVGKSIFSAVVHRR